MIEAAKLRESTSVPVLDNMNLETGEIDTTLQEVA